MASLPLNVAATEALYELLGDRPALFRHHDLAWQRPEGVNSGLHAITLRGAMSRSTNSLGAS